MLRADALVKHRIRKLITGELRNMNTILELINMDTKSEDMTTDLPVGDALRQSELVAYRQTVDGSNQRLTKMHLADLGTQSTNT